MEALGIDLKLLIAQVINFALVFVLLKFFAFKPIAAVLATRRKRIADSLKHAQQIEEAKRTLELKSKQIIAEAKREAHIIIAEAKTESHKIKQENQDELKQERERMLAQAQQEIDERFGQAMREGSKQLGYLVVKLSEKLLSSKIDEQQDRQLLNKLLKEVE